MSSINNIGNTGPVQRIINSPIQKQLGTEAASTGSSAADRLELSGASHLLKTLKQNGDVRVDKVAEIKSAIEAGSYEDDAKLDAAVDRLLEDLLK